ncbi:MAG: hypothetical protein Q6J18_04835 [Gloeomargarita sp. DG02_3_bins_56]
MNKIYEQTNLDWQVRRLQQQIQEWWEFNMTRFNPNLPGLDGIDVPSLYIQLVLGLGLFGLAVWLGLRVTRWWQGRRWRWRLGHPRARGRESAQSEGSWLEQAQAYHAQGDDTEAVRCLYFSLLEYLQMRWGIHALASRTDGEYRRLTRHLDPQESYDLFWQGHERICFNRETVSQEQWQTYWQAYQRVVNG